MFKKGARNSPSNYIPISITSIACKTLEHIIHSNLVHHLERHNILSDHQHVFRKRRSCETQLIQTVDDPAKCLNEGGQIDAVLLDFSKAFDKVSHHHLAAKVHHYGMRGKVMEWVKSFLSSRTQEVILEGKSLHRPSDLRRPTGICTRPHPLPMLHKRSTKPSFLNCTTLC